MKWFVSWRHDLYSGARVCCTAHIIQGREGAVYRKSAIYRWPVAGYGLQAIDIPHSALRLT